MKKVKIPAWVAKCLNDYLELGTNMDVDDCIKEGLIKSFTNSYLNDYTEWIKENPATYVSAMKCAYEIEELYYIKFLSNENGYLNIEKECPSNKNGWFISNNSDTEENQRYQTKFTMKEIEANFPQFKPFAVKVGDEDGCDY
ncbi:hypothetical protein DS832_07075 [Bombilactobacillus bombi]|uniref:DUF1642 domain-containing protein n=1 Tax=Bombilactobacillus bombi TaxID=1303590 RepID=A0A3R6VG88_9LACO|nr:DUF1642 domain-containing protein [Bombilactobacillus bombi]RHW46104.1 hypothetical protein DS832_07075 [Bombilactobacillus bombi]